MKQVDDTRLATISKLSKGVKITNNKIDEGLDFKSINDTAIDIRELNLYYKCSAGIFFLLL